MYTKTIALHMKTLVGLVVALLCVGSFFIAGTAQASSMDAELPKVHSSALLVLGALSSKISTEPQVAASTISDPQIAALMKLLEQLMAMYQAILAAQGGVDDSDDDSSGNDLTLSIRASKSTIEPGESTRIIWSTGGADACVSTGSTIPVPRGSSLGISGNVVVAPIKSAVYTIMCTSGNGESVTRSVTVTVESDSEDEDNNVQSIKLLSPNGGEIYTTGVGGIQIRYRAEGIEGEQVTAYLLRNGADETRSAWAPADDGTSIIEMSLEKGGSDVAGRYKITICVDGENICDTSDRYFSLVDQGEPDMDADFDSSLTYDSVNGTILYASLDFEIENWDQDIVLDVEPTIECGIKISDSGVRDCSGFVFDIEAKAMSGYREVQGDPYVKGGALYRFTGSSENRIVISGYRPDRHNYSEPDYVEFRFVLRDLGNNGVELWSDTERVYFKG